MRKPARKPGRKPGRGSGQFRPGADPRRNRKPPGKPGPGRPPGDFREWVRGRFWRDRELLWTRAAELDRVGVQLIAVLKSIAWAEEYDVKQSGRLIIEHVHDWRDPTG